MHRAMRSTEAGSNRDDFPYLDASFSTAERVEDLISRMTLAEKAGLMFNQVTIMWPGGQLLPADNPMELPGTELLIRDGALNHFTIIGPISDGRELAEWHNRIQSIADQTRLRIPVTIASDPRNAFAENVGTTAQAGAFSQWPEATGLAALRDPETTRLFANTARQEYLAGGIRLALHPQIDLATEPRWARIGQTFGEDAQLSGSLAIAYIDGFTGDGGFGPHSISCVAKHFPGGGPQKDGEDPHFEYGKEQVYPSEAFGYHLEPFRKAVNAGLRQVMPSYGQPIGTQYPEIAFGFNKEILTGLLRDELGFKGIVLSDFGIISDGKIFGQEMPARAWGVENLEEIERVKLGLDAGIDQFGGESCPQHILDLVNSGQISEERIDSSARRILAEKFDLGLFENRYLDPELAASTIGCQEFVAAGRRAQSESMVPLKVTNKSEASLPIRPGLKIYTEGLTTETQSRLGNPVANIDDADLLVLRLHAPFEPRPGGFEAMFHAGSLEFQAGERDRIIGMCLKKPTIVCLYLDRPSVFPEIAECAESLFVDFGASSDAIADVLLGVITPRGKLPFDLPSSMTAVKESASDAPFDTKSPAFRFGDGLKLAW
jgi:beta-glucosidase